MDPFKEAFKGTLLGAEEPGRLVIEDVFEQLEQLSIDADRLWRP